MEGKQTAEPFKLLGKELRTLRAQAQETLAETSGAIEIEVKQLAAFELGRDRPSQEVLLLLISHFDPQDFDAIRLWRLAGYQVRGTEFEDIQPDDSEPAVYTDMLDVAVNRHGIVLEFRQSGKSPKTVAKLGMSRDNALSVMQALHLALRKSEHHSFLLPAPKPDDKIQN